MDIAFCYENVLPARGGCGTYIADLARLYDSFFETYTGAPVLRIDTNRLDFILDTSAQQKVIDSILTTAGARDQGSGVSRPTTDD